MSLGVNIGRQKRHWLVGVIQNLADVKILKKYLSAGVRTSPSVVCTILVAAIPLSILLGPGFFDRHSSGSILSRRAMVVHNKLLLRHGGCIVPHGLVVQH